MTLLLVLAGAMVGAPARHLVNQAVQTRHRTGFPWGILVVNASGSFLLGLVAAFASESLFALFGIGFCGAFTTYSTFAYETHELARTGHHRRAVLNAGLSLAAAIAAVYLGLLAGQAVIG